MTFTSNFTAYDWGLVAVYLLATAAVGYFAKSYIRDMSDYVVAGRSLRSYLGVATLIGSELGLITVMYSAQKGFTGGLAAFHIGLIAGGVTLAVGLSGFIVVPLRARRVLTIPHFYEQRFGTGVRVYGGLLLALAGILNMGLFLKAGAVFVTALTGMHEDWAINTVMTVMIALVLVYTILGGMVSVVITDYLQFVVLSIGMLVACGLALHELGWTTIVNTVYEIHGEAGFDPLSEEGFGLSYVVWQVFTAGLVSCAIWQTAVMRALSAESVAVVRRLYIWSSVGFMIRFVIPQFLGVCALVYFWRDDAAREFFFTPGQSVVDDPSTTLQAMPLFLARIIPIGLIGLIGAGMLAAFMSTHDSYLLCWASVLAEDVVHPLLGKRLESRHRLLLARLFVALIAVFLLVWSLWFPLRQDLWDYMAITGAIYATGAFPLLVLGLYWKRASRTGAYASLTAGILSLAGLTAVKEVLGLDRLESILDMEITQAHVGIVAVVVSVLLMVILSLVFPDRRTVSS